MNPRHPLRTWLHLNARRPSFQWKLAAFILLHAFSIAFLLTFVGSHKPDPMDQFLASAQSGNRLEAFRSSEQFIKQGEIEPLMVVLPHLSSFLVQARDPVAATERIRVSLEAIPAPNREVLLAFWDSLTQDYVSINADLERMQNRDPAPLYAHEAAARIYMMLGDTGSAIEALALEGLNPSADQARKLELQLRISERQNDELRELSKNPLYARNLAPWQYIEIAAANHEWRRVLMMLPNAQFLHTKPFQWILTLTVTGIWTLMLAGMGNWVFKWSGWAQLLIALLLGVCSASATLWLLLWQEQVMPMELTGSLADDLLYCIAGVGLREEGLKLLFFLPLLPLVLRSRFPLLHALVLGGAVGIGFAGTENLGYLAGGQAGVSLTRFLTANFLHLACTGLAAGALTECLLRRRHWDHFLFVFTAVVLLHGVYDLLLLSVLLMEYSMLAMTTFIGLSYWFFRELHRALPNNRSELPLTPMFTAGCALLCGIVFNMAAWQLGLTGGFEAILSGLLGVGVMIYMFAREFESV